MLRGLTEAETSGLQSRLAPILAEGNNSALRQFANSTPQRLKTEAAVLMLLCHTEFSSDLHVVLTKRSVNVTTYKGEVSLPGGKMERTDSSSAHTAMREAKEEIGVPLAYITLLGQLAPVVSRFRQLVVPVIAALNSDFIPTGNSEVEVIFTLPVSRFLSSASHTVQQLSFPGFGRFDLHFFNDQLSGDRQVVTYGLTAHLCIILACLLHFPHLPDFLYQYTQGSRTPLELYQAYQQHNLAYLKHLLSSEPYQPDSKL